MPWCGFWGAAAYWWIVPLIFLVFMGVMFFGCFRVFGCMGRRRRAEGMGRAMPPEPQPGRNIWR